MSFDHNCRFQSSQCNIWEITEFLLNILASFFSSHYFSRPIWIYYDIFYFCNQRKHFFRFVYIYSAANIQKNKTNFSWNMLIQKLSVQNNGSKKKEATQISNGAWGSKYSVHHAWLSFLLILFKIWFLLYYDNYWFCKFAWIYKCIYNHYLL